MQLNTVLINNILSSQSEVKALTETQTSVLSLSEDGRRPSGLKSPYSKIVAENERLRKELKKV